MKTIIWSFDSGKLQAQNEDLMQKFFIEVKGGVRKLNITLS